MTRPAASSRAGPTADDPAIALGALREFLDRAGLGTGELTAERIGGGHSNLTFRLRRGGDSLVLRRPPLGELAPSANDVVREGRIVDALRGTEVEVPAVIAICDDPELLGAPFYLMDYVEGGTLGERPASGLAADAGPRIAAQLVETLARVHAVDLDTAGLAHLARPGDYLERQVRRFSGLLEHNATRPLPELEQVAAWLAERRPRSTEATLVHGDYRLGNLLFALPEPRVVAVLDWEMAAIGDPLADLGYCTAMWADADDPDNPMLDLSRTTRGPGFPSRNEVADLYAERTGRDVGDLAWYQVLAVWKSAIFLEGSYARYRAGESEDHYFAGLGEGVPELRPLGALDLRSRTAGPAAGGPEPSVTEAAPALRGRVALVTGGSRGIGAEIAGALAAAGSAVAVCDVDPAQPPPGIAAYRCDVTSEEDVRGTLAAIEADLGRVDTLVNNAGILRVAKLAETEDADWQALLDVNLTGSFRWTRAVLPAMVEAGFGRIVFLTSITALRGEPRTAAYAASKGGLIGMTRALAREVARRGVTVNAVAPGYVETEQTREAFAGDAGERVRAQVPLGRLAAPAEIAGTVVFLAGRESAYLTGQVIAVDGGVS